MNRVVVGNWAGYPQFSGKTLASLAGEDEAEVKADIEYLLAIRGNANSLDWTEPVEQTPSVPNEQVNSDINGPSQVLDEEWSERVSHKP